MDERRATSLRLRALDLDLAVFQLGVEAEADVRANQEATDEWRRRLSEVTTHG